MNDFIEENISIGSTIDRLFFFYSHRFIQQRLGGPSIAEYEKLQSEMADLQVKYDELLATHKETCKEVALKLSDSILLHVVKNICNE